MSKHPLPLLTLTWATVCLLSVNVSADTFLAFGRLKDRPGFVIAIDGKPFSGEEPRCKVRQFDDVLFAATALTGIESNSFVFDAHTLAQQAVTNGATFDDQIRLFTNLVLPELESLRDFLRSDSPEVYKGRIDAGLMLRVAFAALDNGRPRLTHIRFTISQQGELSREPGEIAVSLIP